MHITRLKFQALLFSFPKDSHSNYLFSITYASRLWCTILWLGMISKTTELLLTRLSRDIMLQGTEYPRDAHKTLFNQFPSSMNNQCYG